LVAFLAGSVSANQPSYVASYDVLYGGQVVDKKVTQGLLADTTKVVVVPAPNPGYTHNVVDLFITNLDTATVVLSVALDVASDTYYTVTKQTLLTGAPFSLSSQSSVTSIVAPQPLDPTASPTFVGATFSGLTASRLVVTGSGKALASNAAMTTGNIPKVVGSGATLADSPLSTDGTDITIASGKLIFTGAQAVAIDFTNLTPAFANQNDAFIKIGTYGTPMTILDTGATFVPVNVSLSSTGNAATSGNQVAAARLRVNAATNNQSNTAIACLQLRSDLSVNVNAVAQLSQSINLSGNVVLNQGECWVAFMQTSGAGNISGSTGELPSVLGCRIGGTGTGFGYAAVLEVNSICTTAGVLKLSTNASATVPSFINFCSSASALVKTGTASGTIVQVTIAINGTPYYLNAYPAQN